jgi:hypothetical protein
VAEGGRLQRPLAAGEHEQETPRDHECPEHTEVLGRPLRSLR